MVRSMMSFTDLPLFLWGHALQSTMFALNRVSSKSMSFMPYEIWHGKKPSIGFLKIWGCPTYVRRQMADKLNTRSTRCYFIGYPKESLGYYFYFPEDHNVIMSRHATFLEEQFIQIESSRRVVRLEETVSKKSSALDQGEPNSQKHTTVNPPRRSGRLSHLPKRYLGIFQEKIEEVFLVKDKDHMDDLRTYDEVISDIDSKKWLNAMKSKIDSMHINHV